MKERHELARQRLRQKLLAEVNVLNGVRKRNDGKRYAVKFTEKTDKVMVKYMIWICPAYCTKISQLYYCRRI